MYRISLGSLGGSALAFPRPPTLARKSNAARRDHRVLILVRTESVVVKKKAFAKGEYGSGGLNSEKCSCCCEVSRLTDVVGTSD